MNGAMNAPRPWWRATAWLLALGTLFFSSYNAANWLASQRADVLSIVFAWETVIPYWPWTIVPYWSIDAFYALSLFVCRTRRELDTHALRLAAVQVISVAVFVAAPLKCTLVRPETTGLYGTLLDALLLFDQPYNQAPALHISLLVVLWVCYAWHTRGALRWLLHMWFALIAVSVLTTYQHHFFDIPTGAWTGLFCLWLFPDHAPSLLRTAAFTRDARRRQLAGRYGASGLLLGAAAIVGNGWTLWLLWVAGSLLLVAAIYAWLDAAAFQKGVDGRMSVASLLLLAPYRAGAWLNSRWWTRGAPAASAVTPQVWLGRMPAHTNDLPAGVQAVVDLCAELPCPAAPRHYTNAGTLDLLPLGIEQLTEAAHSIARALTVAPVLVCCALGYSRSAAAVAAWLLASGHAANAREAIAQVQAARPMVVISDTQRLALEQFAAAQRNTRRDAA